jgi:hypothetical protein
LPWQMPSLFTVWNYIIFHDLLLQLLLVFYRPMLPYIWHITVSVSLRTPQDCWLFHVLRDKLILIVTLYHTHNFLIHGLYQCCYSSRMSHVFLIIKLQTPVEWSPSWKEF